LGGDRHARMLPMPGMVGIDHRGQGKDLMRQALQREARHAIAHMAIDHFGLDRQYTTQHALTRSLWPVSALERPFATVQRPRPRIKGEWLSKRYATRKDGVDARSKALP